MGDGGRRVGIVLDDRSLAHRNPVAADAWGTVDAFERPERLASTRRVLEGSGVLARLTRVMPREATREELELVHTPGHLDRLERAMEGPETVEVGDQAWAGPGSRVPALLAVGGLLECVDGVLEGQLHCAYAVARPPGHHADADHAMGFCLLNATAVAGRHAQRRHGLKRVCILDWDVHHGNGTEAIFADDDTVLTVSLHQAGLYPTDTGAAQSPARANCNVPLPPGTGDAGYALAFERIVEPAIRAFDPDLLVVGAGQDAAASDPLGRMGVTTPGFRAWTERTVALAGELCGGRLVAFMEGGYSLMHLPVANLAILEGLAQIAPSFSADPVGCDVPLDLRDVEREAIERILGGGA